MKYLLSVYCMIFFVQHCLFAQCTADAGPDKFICNSGSVTIGPAGSITGYNYSWSPTTGLSNPNVYNPTASPTSTKTYTLTVTDNLIDNGGFESGDTAFGTDYPYFWDNVDSNFGSYAVTNWVSSYYCRTYPYSGNFLFTARSANLNASNYRIWYNTYNVAPNKNYVFKGLMSNINSYTNGFDVKLIGNNTGPSTTSLSSSVGCNQWEPFSINWSSGSNTSITIELRFNFSGGSLNQLALDNLYFGENCTATDQVTVYKVTSAPSVTPVGPITYYYWYEGAIHIPLTASHAGQWYKNNVAISGATGTTYNATYSGNGTPTDTYKCVNVCGTSNVVTINAIGCTTTSQYPVAIPPQVNCASIAANGWTLSQVNKGTNAIYLWDLPNAVYWQVYDPFARTTFFNLSDVNAPWPATQYVYTRAVAALGSETRMSFGVGITNYSCRTLPPGIPLQSEPEGVLVYPNPAKNEITINWNRPISSITIIDATGRRVKTFALGYRNKVQVNTTGLNKGIYYAEIISGDQKKLIKFVINN